MLTGRNHHSVGMGAITEMATSAPGKLQHPAHKYLPPIKKVAKPG
jgi:arylsulfatase A-like enzyme